MEIIINYDYRQEELMGFNLESMAKDVLVCEGCKDTTSVSINFVTNETIHSLNKEYRGVDRPTDVLSFECDGFDDDFDICLSNQEEFELGDIFIAPDIAQEQALTYGTTFENEINLLMVHGLLHLIGYDHMVKEEAEVMEARETEILTHHGFIRQQFDE